MESSGGTKKLLWKRKWVRGSAWTVGLLTAFGIAYGYTSRLIPLEREAGAIYRRIEAAGTPLDEATFRASIAIPDADNAAIALIPALDAFRKKRDTLSTRDRAALSSWTPEIPEEEKPAAFRKAFAQLEKEWRAVHAAAVRPRFLAPVDQMFDVLAMPSRWKNDIRGAAQLASRSAVEQAKAGNPAAAAREIRLIMTLARYCSDVPTLIDWMVGVAVQAIGVSAARSCMQVDPEHAALYAEAIQKQNLRSAGWALQGEVVSAVAFTRWLGWGDFQTWMIRTPAEESLRKLGLPLEELPQYPEPSPQAVNPVHRGVPRHFFGRATMTRILQAYEPVLATLDADGNEKVPGTLDRALRTEGRRLQSSRAPVDEIPKFFAFFEQLIDVSLRPDADKRVTLAMSEILQFRQRHGRWPTTLAEVGPVPEDPFDPGKPLKYRQVGDGFSVWSIGADRVDQDGVLGNDMSAWYPKAPKPTGAARR